MTNYRVAASCLGDLTKEKMGDWRWVFLLYFEIRLNPAFDGLIEYSDRDGKFVVYDRKRFEETVKVEYPGRSNWYTMVSSLAASGWDLKKVDKDCYEFVHVFGFGVGETVETFLANHSAHDKAVKQVRKIEY